MQYLITGRAGSGKSAIATELVSRGEPAFDGDNIEGLARWEDAKSGAPVIVKDMSRVDSSKVHWNWRSVRLSQLLSDHKDIFLCGGADNDLTFFDRFDGVFVLSLDPETQKQRIQQRDNPYGKHPEMIKIIIAEQEAFVQKATSLGAIAIDATQPVNRVVNDILSYVR